MAMQSSSRRWWLLVALGGALLFLGPLLSWAVHGFRHCPQGLGPEPCRSSLGKGYGLFDGRVILAIGLALLAAVIVGWFWQGPSVPALTAPALGLVALGLALASWRSAATTSDGLTVVLPDVGLYLAMAGALLAILGGSLLLRKQQRGEGRMSPSPPGSRRLLALVLVGLGGTLCISSASFSWASYTELGYHSSLGKGYRLFDGRLILILGAALVLAAVVGWRRRERFSPVVAALGLGVVALGDAVAAWRAIIRIPSPALLASYRPDTGLVLAIIGAVLATVGGCLLLLGTRPPRLEPVLEGPLPGRNPVEATRLD